MLRRAKASEPAPPYRAAHPVALYRRPQPPAAAGGGGLAVRRMLRHLLAERGTVAASLTRTRRHATRTLEIGALALALARR